MGLSPFFKMKHHQIIGFSQIVAKAAGNSQCHFIELPITSKHAWVSNKAVQKIQGRDRCFGADGWMGFGEYLY